jgi:RND family efflux transporter MFP subunit
MKLLKNVKIKRLAVVSGAVVIAVVVLPVLTRGPLKASWASLKGVATKLFRPPGTATASRVAGGQGSSPERRILYYEDPMHPWYRSDKPGIAPDCGMKLVPVYSPEATPAQAPSPGTVQISPDKQQLMGVTTAKAEYRALDKTIRAVGNVALDETRLANVHVKVDGWIQRVFVDATWQMVQKGDPLFTIYSPDLFATQQEYLLALKARNELGASTYREVAAGGESLLEAARQRLLLWDITAEQIHQLEHTRQPLREITYYSPTSGYVIERRVFASQYVTPDTELYKLADLSTVWVQADFYEFEGPQVAVGQEALVIAESLPGQTLRGRVAYIYPDVKPDTRTLTARLEFPNPGLKLKPGMFVNVELHRSLGRALTVPLDAVLDSGERQLVFVDRGNGRFEPRPVKRGESTPEFATILHGLKAGERVVTRANFLIDSESNLRAAIAGMGPMPGMQHSEASAANGPPQPATPAATSTKAVPEQHRH